MVVSNFSTAYYDGEQLQYCILWWYANSVLHTMVISNFSTAYYGGKQLQYFILWW